MAYRSGSQMGYQDEAVMGFQPVAEAHVDVRAEFIKKTYLHVLGAVVGFVALEVAIFKLGYAQAMALSMSQSWMLCLVAFCVVGWLARSVAQSSSSLGLQYLALSGYVLLEALIFAPLLWIATQIDASMIETAAHFTLAGFAGLTAIAFYTRKDFSFLRGVLCWGGMCALGLIIGGALLGFNLGIFFSIGMVALAGASILYDTSRVIHHHPADRHVGAALELFASLALLFYYVLRIVMASRD